MGNKRLGNQFWEKAERATLIRRIRSTYSQREKAQSMVLRQGNSPNMEERLTLLASPTGGTTILRIVVTK